MAMAPSADPAAMPLPPLREDLKLLPAEADEYGTPNWTIHDPVRNRYFRIGLAAFEMLNRWSAGTIAALVGRIERETILSVTVEQVRDMIRFLHGNGLLIRLGADSIAEFGRIAEAGKPPFWKWLVQNYLFVRFPLVRPDRFLRRTQGMADAIASPAMSYAILALGLVGIFLTLRQWDSFLGTFLQFANWQGALWIGLTLMLTKVAHELGHAYTATRYGCRVPTMGVALLVLYPVLYTDTSDAWKLTSRDQRLRIGSAGIRVELALALLATFFWHVLPPGPFRSGVFLVASTTWVSTLLVNLSPFMRFDGYYLLSDLLRVPNLQDRAFRFARWQLREILFSLGDPAPEPMNRQRRRVLTLYAYGVWIYRFFLFLGIALVVYHLFFKLLGILLFIVEILWFIALPVARELKVWWQHRDRIRLNRTTMGLLGGFLLLLAILIVPWRGTVTAGAVLEAEADTVVLSPMAARVADMRVQDGAQVETGNILVVLSSPELDHRRLSMAGELKEAEIRLAQARIASEGLADVASLEKEVLRLGAALAGLDARREQLTVRATLSGTVRDIQPESRTGTWLAAQVPLLRLVADKGAPHIVAYVSQSDIARVQAGAKARFIADDPGLDAVVVRVDSVDPMGAMVLEPAMLASEHGGAIAARAGEDGTMLPEGAIYRLTGTAAHTGTTEGILLARRGTLEIEAPAESLIVHAWQALFAAFVRETAF